MLKKILLVLVVVVVGFLIFAATRPDTYHVERSTEINAPAAVIFDQIEDFKAWPAWSPWEKRDPTMKKTYSGPERGVGAGYAWQGNDKVGEGKMTITAVEVPSEVKLKLEFIKPFASVAETTFHVAASPGAPATTVTWAMDGNNNMVGKIFGIFMNMDSMIGNDFQTGLNQMKTVAETEAKARAAADAAAKAKAAADAKAAEEAKAKADAAAAAAGEADKPKGKKKHK